MVVGLTVVGGVHGTVYRLRQVHEHSQQWERFLVMKLGIIPPRTKINPFIAKPHPALEGRETPIYAWGSLLSQIVPGGPLDPYANPPPTPEAEAKERARLVALVGEKEIAQLEAAQQVHNSWEDHRQSMLDYRQRRKLRADPMAEYYRVLAYAERHPELEIDQAKFRKHIKVDKLKYYR